MRSDTVVGYVYRADLYCPECTRSLLIDAVSSVSGPREMPVMVDTETILDRLATQRGIDRDDQSTYDTDDFPKVVFADQVHDGCSLANGYEPGQCGDQCGHCGEHLGFDCPNTPTNESESD